MSKRTWYRNQISIVLRKQLTCFLSSYKILFKIKKLFLIATLWYKQMFLNNNNFLLAGASVTRYNLLIWNISMSLRPYKPCSGGIEMKNIQLGIKR